MRHPEGACAEAEPRRRPVVERDSRGSGTPFETDPCDRPVLEIPDPDRSGASYDRSRVGANRNLSHELVRLRIDHSDVVRLDLRRATRRIPRREEHRSGDQSSERERQRRQGDWTSPEPLRDGRFGGTTQFARTPQRRKRTGKAISSSLVEADGPIEVLEAVLSKIAQGDAEILFLVLEQRLRRLRYEHLAAVPGCADAGGTVDSETRVLALASRGLARVNAHSHLNLHALGPSVRKKRQLSFNCREHSVARTR